MTLIRSLAASVMSMLSVMALAQTAPGYPQKPVHMIIPFAPGGASDFAGRIISQRLSEALGQQIIIDNRAGASGNIGMDAAAKAPADGYTIFLGNIGTISINPAVFSSLAVHPANPGSLGPVHPVIDRGNRQKPPTLAHVLRFGRKLARLNGRKIPTQRHGHGWPPSMPAQSITSNAIRQITIESATDAVGIIQPLAWRDDKSPLAALLAHRARAAQLRAACLELDAEHFGGALDADALL